MKNFLILSIMLFALMILTFIMLIIGVNNIEDNSTSMAIMGSFLFILSLLGFTNTTHLWHEAIKSSTKEKPE